MKKTQILAIAAFAAAVTFQTAAKAEDPVSPVQGAVCNLYLLEETDNIKKYEEITSSLGGKPAAATFVDIASDFKCSRKKDGINSNWGMWTGWLRQPNAGTYTFTCFGDNYNDYRRYSIWINGVKCASVVRGQYSFNVDLSAGFNSVRIVVQGYEGKALNLTYKKAGSLIDPVAFGPADMFYDDEE